MKSIALYLAATFVLAGSVASADTTIVVTPGNLNGWELRATAPLSNAIGGDGVADLVAGPATPPLGVGSAHLNTGTDGSQSGQLRSKDWKGTKLADLTTLSYSTFATSWNGAQLPFLNLYLDNTSGGSDRLWFEPTYSRAGAGNGNGSPQADPALNTWQTWDVLTGMVYSDNLYGPGSNAKSFATYLAANPNATIRDDGSLGGIRIASGFASSGDVFNAYVDKFQIGTAAGTTTYDFEPIPEPAFFQMGALIGMSGLGLLRLRKRTA